MSDENKQTRWEDFKEKTKDFWEKKGKPFVNKYGPIILLTGAAAILGYHFSKLNLESMEDDSAESESQLPDPVGGNNTDVNEIFTDYQEAQTMRKYPKCKTCGAKMTEFDGWAWYTCPKCGNSVRIIDGVVKWEDEIFTKPKKKGPTTDFELADFCRGGDLTED